MFGSIKMYYFICFNFNIDTLISFIDEDGKQVKLSIVDNIKQLIEQLKEAYKHQFDPYNFDNQSWAIKDSNLDLKLVHNILLIIFDQIFC